MPRIAPPSEVDDIYDYEPQSIGNMNFDTIRRFLDCSPWKCPECGTNNFGRNKECVYCKLRKGIIVKCPDMMNQI